MVSVVTVYKITYSHNVLVVFLNERTLSIILRKDHIEKRQEKIIQFLIVFSYVFIHYASIHIQKGTHIHTHSHIHVHAYTHIHTHTHKHTHTHIHIYTYKSHTPKHTQTHIYYVFYVFYVCMYVCVYVHICI